MSALCDSYDVTRSFIVTGAGAGDHSIFPLSSASMSIFSSQAICQAISFAVRDLGSGRYSDPSGIRANTFRVVVDSCVQKPRNSAFSSTSVPFIVISASSGLVERPRSKSTGRGSGRTLFRRRIVEAALDRVVRVGGDAVIAPEPAHHIGKDRAPLLLSVAADAPRVVQIVALVGQRAHQPHVLQEPVARLVVLAVTSDAAVVVAAVLQVDADRLPVGPPDDVGVGVTAAEVGEAADDAEHLAELVGPLPRDGERRDGARAGAADAAPLRIRRDVVVLREHR